MKISSDLPAFPERYLTIVVISTINVYNVICQKYVSIDQKSFTRAKYHLNSRRLTCRGRLVWKTSAAGGDGRSQNE